MFITKPGEEEEFIAVSYVANFVPDVDERDTYHIVLSNGTPAKARARGNNHSELFAFFADCKKHYWIDFAFTHEFSDGGLRAIFGTNDIYNKASETYAVLEDTDFVWLQEFLTDLRALLATLSAMSTEYGIMDQNLNRQIANTLIRRTIDRIISRATNSYWARAWTRHELLTSSNLTYMACVGGSAPYNLGFRDKRGSSQIK